MIGVKYLPRFERSYKKLKTNQRAAVDQAIAVILDNPLIGKSKKGDLNDIRVYKFSMLRQQTLLSYQYVEQELIILLLAVGPHENFYRDLKKR